MTQDSPQVKETALEPGAPTAASAPPVSVLAPAGYELLGEIGRGGMGAVYQARDLQLNREVAIKLLREDYPADSAAAKRFVLEAQITGQLQHPGIPPVHELGTMPDGQPFLAMKLVKGKTLAALLEASTGHESGEDRARLIAIFEQIAQAVGYAHAHRVIHRDLKPGNVMVGAFGEVQVMDWGLAKVLPETPAADEPTHRAEEETAAYVTQIETPMAADSATRTGAMLGTPHYIPPEQAGGEIRKLDARSDVFGLGAILCNILTGQPPYRGGDGNAVRLMAVRGELQDAFARLDACGAEPELVALCKRCLSFKPEHRPADGGAVAQEVARIRAAAQDRARQAELERAEALVRETEQRKRRRVWFSLAATFLVGLIASAALAIQASRERQRAEQAATAEKQANEQAQKRLSQIEKGNELIASIFTDLDLREIKQGTEPLEAVLAQRLVKAAEQLEAESVGDPLAVAQLQDRLGRSLLHLGHPQPAIGLFEKARTTRTALLGPEHPDTLTSISNLASGYHQAGQLDKAVPLYEDALRRRQASLGADHPDTLLSMDNLATGYQAAGQLDKAVPLYEETLRLTNGKLGADHPDTLRSMNNLASGYRAAGQPDKALPLFEEALRLMKAKLGPEHLDTLRSMNNLALAYQSSGQVDKALPLYEQTLRLREAKLGAEHPDTLRSMNNLASGYRAAGQLDKALPLYEATLRLKKSKLGADHPETLTSMNNLALGYQAARQLDKALPLYEETLRLLKSKLPADHPNTLSTMSNLAAAYRAAGQPGKALPLFEQAAIGVQKRRFQYEHAGRIVMNFVDALEEAKNWVKAETWRRQWLAVVKERAGADSGAHASELAGLGENLLQQRKFAAAEAVLRECLAFREKKEPDAWTTFNTKSMLGEALAGQKQHAAAEPLLVQGYEGMKQRETKIPPQAKELRLREAVARLVQLYDAWGKKDKAAQWRKNLDTAKK